MAHHSSEPLDQQQRKEKPLEDVPTLILLTEELLILQVLIFTHIEELQWHLRNIEG